VNCTLLHQVVPSFSIGPQLPTIPTTSDIPSLGFVHAHAMPHACYPFFHLSSFHCITLYMQLRLVRKYIPSQSVERHFYSSAVCSTATKISARYLGQDEQSALDITTQSGIRSAKVSLGRSRGDCCHCAIGCTDRNCQ